MFHRVRYVAIVGLVALGAVPACNQSGSAEGGTAAAASASAASVVPKAAAARVVFVDKEEACECTQAKIDAGWTAVQAAIGSTTAVKLERIHMDSQPGVAAPILAKRQIVAVPAAYVLDATGNVLDVFQGDIEEQAVRNALR